jgi:HEAT repeat protein
MINILENDHDPCVRHEVAAQLYRIEERKPQLMANLRTRVVSALFDRAWNDESVVVRHESIEVLGYIADAQSLSALRRLTVDENLDISSTAEIALRTATRRIAEGIKTHDLCSELIARWPEEETGSLTK